MRVAVDQLRQQMWRADKLYADLLRYAREIGCRVVQDEVITLDAEQARKLATWWTEHTT